MSMGKYGGIIITGTTAVTGPFCGVFAFDDSTLDTGTTSPNISGTFSGLVIPAGSVMVGNFSVLKFSGTPKVLAYYGHAEQK